MGMKNVQEFRREFLKMAGLGMAGGAVTLAGSMEAQPRKGAATAAREVYYDVRRFGATGDGQTIDSPAINRAIEAAANAGGGTVMFPAGVYASYSIRLKSNVALYLSQGATILAATVPMDGLKTGGYDAAEPQNPTIEKFQDYGHNHWHNSLIWGEDLHDIGIFGPGLIWGKGLARGEKAEVDLPASTSPGVGNKAIALKNCRNVILSDFSVLRGGWFCILVTGVDNLTIDNLKIDTSRDGIDVDCCRNVRISNCTVNSPQDDGICPKSSYALGYRRDTINVTITGCYVTGGYQVGTVLDGTWKPHVNPVRFYGHGRIKCGTESNGGFRNITISDCTFDTCRGFALETADGANLEDITFTGITMRGVRGAPLFLRLQSRMRGPKEIPVGTLKRVLMSNVTSHDADPMPSIFAGIPDHAIEDVKLSDSYFHHAPIESVAAASNVQMSAIDKGHASSGYGQAGPAPLGPDGIPQELPQGYPEPNMFGDVPASGLYARHIRNLELTNVEFANQSTSDTRPTMLLADADGVDLFRLRLPRRLQEKQFRLHNAQDFRLFGCQFYRDEKVDHATDQTV
ncbi:glycoside hydrolase family 28 protein [Terriglobus sp. TAA 43]|uniref:rhamnogalacturonidase n=1 Tax=Terriglobus sp. TAA 43 TaxID=278961 RepID=UPI000AC641AA|nr:glycoside hydrolase family 28 protein [Terriglobus sp. TAA 43]